MMLEMARKPLPLSEIKRPVLWTSPHFLAKKFRNETHKRLEEIRKSLQGDDRLI